MTLTQKIARLVAERGWNQDAFAKQARLNRNTVRQILSRPDKRLRNSTIRSCADALGIPVHELKELPVEKLLARMRPNSGPSVEDLPRLEPAMQPELQAWIERNPQRAGTLSSEEKEELISLQGTGGPLTRFGVDHFVEQLERKRELRKKMDAIAGTEYLELLEQLVRLIYDKIQPYRNP